MGQSAAVAPDKAGGVGSGSPQGDAALFTDQFFPVNAGADGDLGFQLIRHGQNSFGNGSVVAAAVLRDGEV